MDWKNYRRTTEAMSDDGEIAYIIFEKRSGKYYIDASLPGGAEHKLPFQDFATVAEAQRWAEGYEARRAERRARYADEEPIRL